MRLPPVRLAAYPALLAASLVAAMLGGYSALGRQIDGDVYDFLMRLRPARWQPEAIVVAIDEASLLPPNPGLRGLRTLLAELLEKIAVSRPRLVVVDLTLADSSDPHQDARLEDALAQVPNLVLASEMLPDGSGWQDPLPRFRSHAAALGHVHAEPDELDGVARRIALEKVAGQRRLWALALEAYRLHLGSPAIVESPYDIQLGSVLVPAPRSEARSIYVRYLPPPSSSEPAIPRISAVRLLRDPALLASLRGKPIFVGVTAQSAARDRLITPFGSDRPMPGVEVHASLFETLRYGKFLRRASETTLLGLCALLVVLSGLAFRFMAGISAYLAAASIVLAAVSLPYVFYLHDIVFPFSAPVLASWLSVGSASAYQYFVARRRLRRAEAEKARYQRAVHFVTHEMRTPLTAIQGSSELMARYPLPEEKRKQIAMLIHSESKRLASMVETFLNVERLSAGQIALRKQNVSAGELIHTCLARVQPLAEKKSITIEAPTEVELHFPADRELLEYALYNLLTNAIKYSPAGSVVRVTVSESSGEVRFSVQDQGIGMDEKEMRGLFRKFYRTRRAIETGESGLGIGLSLVHEIVSHHRGRIEVTSAPGQGSCFTLVLPAHNGAGEV